MKQILLCFSAVFFSINVFAQNNLNIPSKFPTEFGKKYTFPLGSKITLELKEISENKYEYRVLSVEKIKEFYAMDSSESLFLKELKKNTVELFFMGAFYNSGKEDKDWKSVLILRNNLSKTIKYKADIKYYYNENFENTSILDAFPNTKTTEIWAQKIDFITLYDFKILK